MNTIFSMIKKGILYWKINGFSQTKEKVLHYIKYNGGKILPFNESYKQWIKNCEKIDESEIRREMQSFSYRPLFSVCIPVYNAEEKWLRKCLASIENQYYENWQICLADDCSPDERVREILREYEKKDDRIKAVYRKENGHISKATNSALELAEGEFIVLMDNDDELSPDALFEAAKLLQKHKDADVIYSDEDKITEWGERINPYMKPDYCPDTLLSYNYISHLGIYRKEMVDKVGGFRTGVEGSQDYDLLLRITEFTNKVYHIPKVLYHGRGVEDSAALDGGQKNYVYLAGKKVLEDAVIRRGYHAEVQFLEKILCYNVRFFPTKQHLISIIIPTKDKAEVLERCLASIYAKTKEQAFEIIIIDNDSKEDKTFALFHRYEKEENFRVITLAEPFNFSRLNNKAVKEAKGDLLLFLNNDIEVITEDWLTLMAGEAERREIGAVGVKLLYPNNTIQHVGVILGLGSVAGHIGVGKDRYDNGYMSHLATRRNYSAVTAACLMIRKEIFEEVDGFEEQLEVAYNDVDFCLKVREKGYRNIYLADVELYHYESLSRGIEDTSEKIIRYGSEVSFMNDKWGEQLKADPCYNKNFDLNRREMQLRTFQEK
ncbi:MAG: glycosyltransferase family 2 protein [Eubacteriales bacterium]|nr:glycosyltransferase family 2 protein [Eubacteriales bacterium]